MSDFILEILEPVANTIEIETSILDSVTENVTIEYEYNNTIDIINTEKILASDIPYGYDINDTTGNLPYSRVENLETYIQSFIPQQSSVAIDGGSP
jgi:hypothetical protein